jgi:hypothetical protein
MISPKTVSLGGAETCKVGTKQFNGALWGKHQASDQGEQGAFAASAWPAHQQLLAFLKLPAFEIDQRFMHPIGELQSMKVNQWSFHALNNDMDRS